MEAIIVIGVPGSGKSTWAKSQVADFGGRLIELDMARKEINGDEASQDNIKEVVALRNQWLKEAAEGGHDVYISDTNIIEEHRDKLLDDLLMLGYSVTFRVMRTPHDLSRARNAARDRVVPDYAMDKMIQEFDRQFGRPV